MNTTKKWVTSNCTQAIRNTIYGINNKVPVKKGKVNLIVKGETSGGKKVNYKFAGTDIKGLPFGTYAITEE